jgi:hypothetical protein
VSGTIEILDPPCAGDTFIFENVHLGKHKGQTREAPREFDRRRTSASAAPFVGGFGA